MGVSFIMLTQQVPAVVVAIRRCDDRVYVLTIGSIRIEGPQSDGPFVIEFDQDLGTVDRIVNHRLVICAADPRKVGLIKVRLVLRKFH